MVLTAEILMWTLYEAAPQLGEVGAEISLAPNYAAHNVPDLALRV